MKFSRLHGKLRLQMHDLQVGAHNLKITIHAKSIVLLTMSMFQAGLKP